MGLWLRVSGFGGFGLRGLGFRGCFGLRGLGVKGLGTKEMACKLGSIAKQSSWKRGS